MTEDKPCPKHGAVIDVCDKRGNESRCMSLGWRGSKGRLVVKDMQTKETRLATEWKHTFEGTGAWRR